MRIRRNTEDSPKNSGTKTCRASKPRLFSSSFVFFNRLFSRQNESFGKLAHFCYFTLIPQWTPSGDAFVIGSDLKRLESETLPQYFRHNRFQSLVRQLNFYSFRKINRERNVWIYKHELFHRDHDEDLHLVRRRTCPGMDGRKQRFSRFSTRKNGQLEDDHKTGEDDASSAEDDAASLADFAESRKRDLEPSETVSKTPLSKRSRRLWGSGGHAPAKTDVVVDTSMIQAVNVPVEEEEDEEVALSVSRNSRVEMAEQSMIVSEVAMKLRKVLKGRVSRSRRGGVVTPPYGGSQHYPTSATSLLTYDDEYASEDFTSSERSGSGLDVVTDGDDSASMTSEEDTSHLAMEPATVTPIKSKEVTTPLVNDYKTAKTITGRILLSSPESYRASLISPATVAGFCMSTSPQGDKDLCSKILQLIASCDDLAIEFQLYRAALHPTDQGEAPSFAFVPNPRENRAVTVQQIWEREASRGDAVRDFKTFAVNCVHSLLRNCGDMESDMPLSDEDKVVLECTAALWLKSTGSMS
jgi:hypothetical protein